MKNKPNYLQSDMDDINGIKFKNNEEAMFYYILNSNLKKLEKLFKENDINIEATDSKGNTAFNLAAQIGNEQIINFILSFNPNINTKNCRNNTPLHYALALRNFGLADILIQKEADELAENDQGLTPWKCLTVDNVLL
ncbi:MAG: ankyrin repeat domain-containing protein [archaeon]|nr:ankyrin repeat domain-containing protein [archaeon]